MLISELIKTLIELQKKHGDLTVFADEEGREPYEVEVAKYVDIPPEALWGSADEMPGIKGILLQSDI